MAFEYLTTPLSALWGAGQYAAKAGKAVARTGMGPMVGGAAIGGIYGAFRGDVTGAGRAEEIFKHAALGAIGGAGLKAGIKYGPGLVKKGFRPTMSAGATAARGAWGAGKFAARHPWATAATVGGIGGALYMGGRGGATPGTSPTLSGAAMNYNFNNQAIASNELMAGSLAPMGFVGTAPEYQQHMSQQMNRARMAQSTQGLVQGLHRGRH